MCRTCSRRSKDCFYDVEKTKHQSLVERLQQAQDRVKEVEESREALRQVFHAVDFDMGITRKGKSYVLGGSYRCTDASVPIIYELYADIAHRRQS